MMKKTIGSTIALLLLWLTAFSQSVPPCGSIPDQGKYSYDSALESKMMGFAKKNMGIVRVRLQPHVIRRTDGTGGLSATSLNNSLNQLNADYAPVGIIFDICSTNFIDNDTFFNEIIMVQNTTDSGLEYDMALPNIDSEAVNVFFVPNGVVYFNGIAYQVNWGTFPSYRSLFNKNWVVMTNSFADENQIGAHKATLSHEVGHYLNLRHTHSDFSPSIASRQERVLRTSSGSCTANCSSVTDELCDTAADPVLDTDVNSQCKYIGTATDPCGIAYTPDPLNIMSYAYYCREYFTEGQKARMLASIAADRPELASSCSGLGCPTNLLAIQNVSSGSTVLFEASNILTAVNEVEGGATAILTAGGEINLYPGFDALPGSSLDAYISPCASVKKNEVASTSTEEAAMGAGAFAFQILPNPLSDRGLVRYALAADSKVAISMRNLLGSEVKTIQRETRQREGAHEVPIDLTGFAAGVFLVELRVNGKRYYRKMIVE